MRQGWRKGSQAALLAMVAGVAILSQACGGGSTATKATPTAKPLPSRSAAQGTPRFRGGTPPADFTPPAGAGNGTFPGGAPPGDLTPPAGADNGMFMGNLNPALAQFLSISEDQLQSELAAEGATIGTVAQAHGKTRDELKVFLARLIGTSADQAVAEGRMSQDEAITLVQNLSSRVNDIIDGKMPRFGGPPPTTEPGQ